MKANIGVITIGQSPRADMTEDINNILRDKFNVIEKGALDSFDIGYVRQNLYPESGDTVLVSRMRNGEEVILSEEKIIPLLQKCIYELEAQGCKIVILLCTGKFPEFKHECLLIYPQKIVHKLAEALLEDGVLGIIVPNSEQVEKMKSYWGGRGVRTKIVSASPYLSIEGIYGVCREFDETNPFILMDCMGYTGAMSDIVRENTGKIVILPRNIIFAVVSQLA